MSNIIKKSGEAKDLCKYCGVVHIEDAYNFYLNPNVKSVLLELKKRYETLPPDEQSYRMDNWAVKRGLRLNSIITVMGDGQKKPEGGTVVMCGYAKLVDADIWLRKMEGNERD